jgi:hypothetical protein
MGLEPTIPVFEQAKTFQALDRAATVIGEFYITVVLFLHYFEYVGAVHNKTKRNINAKTLPILPHMRL